MGPRRPRRQRVPRRRRGTARRTEGAGALRGQPRGPRRRGLHRLPVRRRSPPSTAQTYDIARALDGFPPDQIRRYRRRVRDRRRRSSCTRTSGSPTVRAGRRPRACLRSCSSTAARSRAASPGTRPLLMEALDRAGIVAIDIEYRLAPPPRWNEAPGDVLCALAWSGRASELAGSSTRDGVVLAGESSGGSLALVAGYAAGTDAIASSCPGARRADRRRPDLGVAPTADLQGIWQDATISDFSGTRFPEAYIGGSPDQFPERYAAAEPFRLLRADLPRTMILAGEIDRLVQLGPTDLARRSHSRGRARGRPAARAVRRPRLRRRARHFGGAARRDAGARLRPRRDRLTTTARADSLRSVRSCVAPFGGSEWAIPTAVAARLVFWFATQRVWEDSLITISHARNARQWPGADPPRRRAPHARLHLGDLRAHSARRRGDQPGRGTPRRSGSSPSLPRPSRSLSRIG